MRKILYFLLLLILFKATDAQQLHFTSIFQQHNAMYNPGAAGFSGNAVLGTTYRSMWSAFPGNPRTFMVYADVPWEKKNAGFAGYLYRDVTGPTSRTGIQAVYSYHVKTGEKSRLGLGIELRGLQYAIDKSKLTDALGSDLVLAGANSSFKLDAGAGVYFSDGKFSAGAAVSQLIQTKLAFNDVPNATERAKLYRHFNITANYLFETGGGTHLIPNFMMRIVPHAPTEYDFGCKVDYQNKIWWALNWRIRQFWSVQVGFKLAEKLSFAYAYDYYNSPFSDYNTGNNAHEVGLRFDLKKK